MKIDDLKYMIYEKVNNKLEEIVWYDDVRHLEIDEIIEKQIEELLNKPEIIEKLIKATHKEAMKKHKELTKRRKESDREEKEQKDRLWNATKGIIPCIQNCGNTKKYKKDELGYKMKWICPECDKQAKENNINVFDLFDKPMIINGKEFDY